jgi:hypothetical protein
VQTDRTNPNSKPEFIIHVNEKGTCMLINVAIPGDRNVIKKEAEMVHFSHCNRITAHVECKTEVIPVIIGATGTFSESFKEYLMNKPV